MSVFDRLVLADKALYVKYKVHVLDIAVVVLYTVVSRMISVAIGRLVTQPLGKEQKKLYTLQREVKRLQRREADEKEVEEAKQRVKDQEEVIAILRRNQGPSILPLLINFGLPMLMGRFLTFYFKDIIHHRPVAFRLPKGVIPKDSFVQRLLASGIKTPRDGEVSYFFLMRFLGYFVSALIIRPLFKIPKQPGFFARMKMMAERMMPGEGMQ